MWFQQAAGSQENHRIALEGAIRAWVQLEAKNCWEVKPGSREDLSWASLELCSCSISKLKCLLDFQTSLLQPRYFKQLKEEEKRIFP